MAEALNLEETLDVLVSRFSRENSLHYNIESQTGNGGRGIGILIGEVTPGHEIHEFFRHSVTFSDDGKCVIDQRTLQVASGMAPVAFQARKTYVKFIEYMNTEGIPLENGFADLWAQNPTEYPM